MKKPIARVETALPSVLDIHDDNYGENKVERNGIFYLINGRDIYMEAFLTLYQRDLKEAFSWVLWVKTSASEIINMSEKMTGKSHLIKGNLVSPVLFYENTDNLEVRLVLRDY